MTTTYDVVVRGFLEQDFAEGVAAQLRISAPPSVKVAVVAADSALGEVIETLIDTPLLTMASPPRMGAAIADDEDDDESEDDE